MSDRTRWRAPRGRGVTRRPGYAGVLLVAALLAAGCTTASERRSAEGSGRPPIRSSGECSLDLADAKTETVFYVLGFLNEYNGRQIVEEGEEVETLYCSETDLAEDFRAVLAQLSAEQNLPAPKEEREQECVTVFNSVELTARLNSCYQYELNVSSMASAASGQVAQRVASGTFNFALLYGPHGVDHARARAYLRGAWRRSGHDGSFTFANAREKAEGIARLLSSIGCSGVSVEHTVGMIPGWWRVKFTPSDEVGAWLAMTPGGGPAGRE